MEAEPNTAPIPHLPVAKDFLQAPRPASPSRSAPSVRSNQQGSEVVRLDTIGTGYASLVPGPNAGPLRRNTTNIATEDGQSEVVRQTSRSFPTITATTTLTGARRPFFISPLLKTPKTSRDVSPERATVQNLVVQAQMPQPEKRDTNATDTTEEEWEHRMRMERKRRVQEFPRRLATSIVGGIFVIAPMVIMSINRSLAKDLITSSVSIVLFGLTLAWVSTSDEISLFVATVGYAAFLAVFVAVGDEDIHVRTIE